MHPLTGRNSVYTEMTQLKHIAGHTHTQQVIWKERAEKPFCQLRRLALVHMCARRRARTNWAPLSKQCRRPNLNGDN